MVYMMVGIQGSGKSTYATHLGEKLNIPVLSSDRLRQEFAGVKDYIIWPFLYSRAYLYLKNKQDFIFDATNITIDIRKKFIDGLALYGLTDFDITCVYVKASRETCIKRVTKRNNDPSELFLPLDVIDMYINRFEEPTLAEGFKEIKIIEND